MSNEAGDGEKREDRRSFLGKASALLSAAAVSMLGCDAEERAPTLPTSPMFSTNKEWRRYHYPRFKAYKGEPLPFSPFRLDYLPSGFTTPVQLIGLPDGFRAEYAELAFRAEASFIERKYWRLLQVFGTSQPVAPFGGTDQREPTSVVDVNNPQLGTSRARYYNGMWTVDRPPPINGVKQRARGRKWDSTHAHSLVFAVGAMSFGIRGSIRAGVDLATLVRVAEGIRQNDS